MAFIIFDLEWNPVYRQGKFAYQEITEIGAVEVMDIDGMLMIGRKFHAYVKSRNQISKKIKQLTNVKEPDTWLAYRFPVVMNNFYRWLGNQSYIFCSWGEDDRQVLLKNLLFYQLKTDRFTQYFNFQHAFSTIEEFRNGNQIGLRNALGKLALEFEGSPHRSIDDAYNTARLFVKVFPKLSILPEPFVHNLTYDIDYRKRVEQVILLRKRFGLSYQELSLLSDISTEELEQIELYKVAKSKKEMMRLIHILYDHRGGTLGKE